MMFAATSAEARAANRLVNTPNREGRSLYEAANAEIAAATQADAGPRNDAARRATMKDAEIEVSPWARATVQPATRAPTPSTGVSEFTRSRCASIAAIATHAATAIGM